jgi:hypothetical protein
MWLVVEINIIDTNITEQMSTRLESKLMQKDPIVSYTAEGP